MSILLQLSKGAKSFGPKQLFENAQFSVNQGEHIGVIGPNGAGKSTLFKILVGEQELDEGEIIKSSGIRVGYLQQEDDFDTNQTLEELLLSDCLTPIWNLKSFGIGLGLNNDHFAAPYKTLSGGFRMRFKLLRLLGQEPHLLMLDEPTNYLDLESLIILEKFLVEFKGAFLLISHDREFLRQTTDHILEIEAGQFSKFHGHIDDYFEQKAAIQKIMQKQAQNIEDQKQQIQQFADRFRAKATKAKQVQSRLKKLDKMESIEIASLPVKAKIHLPQPIRTGKEILRTENLQLGYGDSVILNDVSLVLSRGDHLGIVGVNGAGKTTFLKSLAGELPPISGQFQWGHNVKVGYYAQHVPEALVPDQNIEQALQAKAHPDVTLQDVRDMAGALLFSSDDREKKISVLSGGEKARVALGQILLEKSPCLLLDEPTNHLDFHTVEALTLALSKYESSIIVVSHDRSFIGRISKKILEIRDGSVEIYPGTYDEYVWSLKKGTWGATNQVGSTPPNISESDVPTKPKSEVNRKNLSKLIRSQKAKIRDVQKLLTDEQSILDQLLEKLGTMQGPEAANVQKELAKSQKNKEELEDTWLELNEKLEALENQ